jgi:hypothetical protein
MTCSTMDDCLAFSSSCMPLDCTKSAMTPSCTSGSVLYEFLLMELGTNSEHDFLTSHTLEEYRMTKFSRRRFSALNRTLRSPNTALELWTLTEPDAARIHSHPYCPNIDRNADSRERISRRSTCPLRPAHLPGRFTLMQKLPTAHRRPSLSHARVFSPICICSSRFRMLPLAANLSLTGTASSSVPTGMER